MRGEDRRGRGRAGGGTCRGERGGAVLEGVHARGSAGGGTCRGERGSAGAEVRGEGQCWSRGERGGAVLEQR